MQSMFRKQLNSSWLVAILMVDLAHDLDPKVMLDKFIVVLDLWPFVDAWKRLMLNARLNGWQIDNVRQEDCVVSFLP
jgi:hypothetical protein